MEAYRHSWEPEPVWQVFDREGRWLAAVRTPPRFRIHQVGDDHLLGVWRDEDEVEHIRVYPLVR